MKDKVIVITGASSGIGAALAEEVGHRGARVVLAARRKAELAEVASRCGLDAMAVVADVTRRADVDKLRDLAIEKFGGIDVWVNNAGVAIWRAPSQLTDEDIDEMIRINVKSALYGMQAVLPHFKKKRRGHLIDVSSGLSRFPFAPNRSAYSASKAALNMLHASLRGELAVEFPEIKTTLVLPGVVATDFGRNARHGGIDNRQIPGAQPVEEVAKVIADVIEKPRAEVYTRPQMLLLASRYFATEEVDQLEHQPPFHVPAK